MTRVLYHVCASDFDAVEPKLEVPVRARFEEVPLSPR